MSEVRTMEEFKRACDGCNALDDQLDRVRVAEARLVAVRKERIELGGRLSDKTQEWVEAVELAERAVAAKEKAEEELRRMQKQAEADTQLISDLRSKEQDYERLRKELESLKKSMLCDACKAAIFQPPYKMGVDLGVGPDQTVKQHGVMFSCPAGCKHTVFLPMDASAEEVCAAITEQTGLASRRGADGALEWDRHEVVPGEIVGGERFKTIEEYSADITDPLATARTELDHIIGDLDADKAWLAGTPAPAHAERDLYISALETFMAAMLKWAQGIERAPAEAITIVPGGDLR